MSFLQPYLMYHLLHLGNGDMTVWDGARICFFYADGTFMGTCRNRKSFDRLQSYGLITTTDHGCVDGVPVWKYKLTRTGWLYIRSYSEKNDYPLTVPDRSSYPGETERIAFTCDGCGETIELDLPLNELIPFTGCCEVCAHPYEEEAFRDGDRDLNPPTRVGQVIA